MSISKSRKESFFVRIDLRSITAQELFNEESVFNCEEVIVLQVMYCTNDVVIAEIIRKEDYLGECYYHEGEKVEVYKNESNM
ncbi:hypothetical protein [Clostridium sp. B9]|uniref:hypothetical protein n=1 Tax=Clostridium sp. B9 TaxID=3423224 RepID=UPI003D2F377E